jgi:hypothetical protein
LDYPAFKSAVPEDERVQFPALALHVTARGARQVAPDRPSAQSPCKQLIEFCYRIRGRTTETKDLMAGSLRVLSSRARVVKERGLLGGEVPEPSLAGSTVIA